MQTLYEADHDGVFNGRSLTYRFSLEAHSVSGEHGDELGTATTHSYIADLDDSERARRPVVFLFNGGPGGSSLPLHLSGLGPKRARTPEDLSASAASYQVEDSTWSLLDVADLVFMDPINTGYGAFTSHERTDKAYSVVGDAGYFAEMIRAWLRRTQRWDSPKYILGESYGTVRAPFVAEALMSGMDALPFAGIVLISQAVNIQETAERPGNITGTLAALTFKAATAHYHGHDAGTYTSVDQVCDAALEFGYDHLAAALMKGNRIGSREMSDVAGRLEGLTGIPADEYIRRRLWVPKAEFCTRLLAADRQVVGRSDSRYVSPAHDPAAGEAGIDPSSRAMPSFAAGGARYFSEALGVPSDLEYRVVDTRASADWDWTDPASRGYLVTGKPSPFTLYPYAVHLARYLKLVPDSRLFVGTGHYDSMTTVGAAEHLLRQYEIPLERVCTGRYPGGHMMYTDRAVSVQLASDLRTFITGADKDGQ